MLARVRLASSLVACATVALLAWGAYAWFAPNPNDIEPALLAPMLLPDGEEMGRYVAEFPAGEYKIAKVEGVGSFYLDGINDEIKNWLRRGLVWEPYIVNLMSKHVVPGTTVVDAGAHIGSHTMTLARLVGRSGRVYAFEPQKKLYRELRQNLKLNDERNVVALRFALGDHPGIVEMSKSATGNEGGTAIGKGGDKAELRTIDSFGLRNVSFMKIDVEGYEDHVLDGAAETIRTQHPVVLVEIQDGEDYDKTTPERKRQIEHTIAKLKAFGYSAQRVSKHDYLATYPGRGSP